MKPGRLKHRITLQRFESGRGPLGEPVTSWIDYATVWAEVKGISDVSWRLLAHFYQMPR